MKKLIKFLKRFFTYECPLADECELYQDCPSCTHDFNPRYCGRYRSQNDKRKN